MGEISVKTGNNARNGGKNSLNRLIRCVCGKKIGPDPRNFNQRVSLGRNDLLIRTFLSPLSRILASLFSPAVILSLQLLIVGIIVAMLISCIRVDYNSIVINLFADCLGW
ncbi:hypothetical protein HVZ71_21825 [Escherichia coli]|nr:hypothetical protein HVZ71_21825 [Escherichia coli]